MKKIKKNIDYDKLLDDWADELYKTADKHKAKEGSSETGSFHHGYHKGVHEGMIEALCKLSFLENRRTSKYKIKDDV